MRLDLHVDDPRVTINYYCLGALESEAWNYVVLYFEAHRRRPYVERGVYPLQTHLPATRPQLLTQGPARHQSIPRRAPSTLDSRTLVCASIKNTRSCVARTAL